MGCEHNQIYASHAINIACGLFRIFYPIIELKLGDWHTWMVMASIILSTICRKINREKDKIVVVINYNDAQIYNLFG